MSIVRTDTCSVMKTLIVVTAIAILGALILAVVLSSKRSTRSPEVLSRPSIENIINVHGAEKKSLRICGRTFHNLMGGPPYYIAVTNTSLILFAYEPTKGSRTLIICDTNDYTFREIALHDCVFGDQIGYWNATNGKMGDTVESSTSNRLYVLSKGFKYTERAVVDLTAGSVRVVGVQSEYNKPGLDNLTNWFR